MIESPRKGMRRKIPAMKWLSDLALEEPLTKQTSWEVLREYRQELFKQMELSLRSLS
jgi:hypothetical protein